MYSTRVPGVEIENKSCDLGHAPCRSGQTVTRKLALCVVYPCAKFDDSSFSRSRDIIGAPKIQNGSCDSNHAPFKDVLSSECWDLT